MSCKPSLSKSVFPSVHPASNVPAALLGGAASPFADALGYWVGLDYATSGRVVPNRKSTDSPSRRVTRAPRNAFSKAFYTKNLLTATDYYGLSPDGKTEASRVVSSGASWFLSTTISEPAGTYTLSVWLKSNTGSDQTMKIVLGVTSLTITVTSAWQQFSVTVTTAGSLTSCFVIQNVAGAAIDVLIADAEVVPGASTPTAETQSGHMYLSKASGDSFSAGELDFSTAGTKDGFLQFQSLTLDEFTILGLFSKTGASSGFVTLLSKLEDYLEYSAFIENSDTPRPSWKSGAAPNYGLDNIDGFSQVVNTGYHVFGVRRVGGLLQYLIDGHVWRERTTTGTVDLQNLWVATMHSETGYGGGYKSKALAFWQRAITDDEVSQASSSMTQEAGESVTPLNLLIVEGDSLTTGTSSYWLPYLANTTQPVLSVNYAGGGNTIPLNLNPRLPTILKAAGSTHNVIASILMTNGAGDTYMSDLQTWVTSCKDAGFKVAVATLTPRNSAPHNVLRNAYNTTIRTWPGLGICDAVIDFAADPDIGPDAAASDAFWYPDGTHPSAAGQARMETIYRPVINSLLV